MDQTQDTNPSPPRTAERRAITLFGFECAPVTLAEAANDAASSIESREQHRILFLNAAKVADDEIAYRNILGRAERLYADGQSIVMASRLAGVPLPERVAGVDLMEMLLERANRDRWRVYLLGSTDAILERACEVIAERFPEAVIAGSHNGYFDPTDNAEKARVIRGSRPDLVLVAMPSPRKEEWVLEFGPATGAPVVMAIGGSLEVLTGEVRRAPILFQRMGLEWAWRVGQEPGRLWRRYAKSNLVFIWRAGREALRIRMDDRSRGPEAGST